MNWLNTLSVLYILLKRIKIEQTLLPNIESKINFRKGVVCLLAYEESVPVIFIDVSNQPKLWRFCSCTLPTELLLKSAGEKWRAFLQIGVVILYPETHSLTIVYTDQPCCGVTTVYIPINQDAVWQHSSTINQDAVWQSSTCRLIRTQCDDCLHRSTRTQRPINQDTVTDQTGRSVTIAVQQW